MLPRTFTRVEWRAARRFDRPNDRRERASNFVDARMAARQVRSILAWPEHMTLVGVWQTDGWDDDGLVWRPIPIKALPPPPDDEIDPVYGPVESVVPPS